MINETIKPQGMGLLEQLASTYHRIVRGGLILGLAGYMAFTGCREASPTTDKPNQVYVNFDGESPQDLFTIGPIEGGFYMVAEFRGNGRTVQRDSVTVSAREYGSPVLKDSRTVEIKMVDRFGWDRVVTVEGHNVKVKPERDMRLMYRRD